MRNGRLASDAVANSGPAISGAAATPRLRAIPVTPAAADRSSGATIAIVYDCRVGTSIWLIAKRARSAVTASGRVGISGTSISSTFDGRCVNTIVRTSPKRAASRPAASAEKPASRFAAASTSPSAAGSTPYRVWNQNAMKPWIANPPANASSANSIDRRSTTDRERWRPSRSRIVPSAAACAGTSTRADTRVNSSARAAPTSA